MTLFHSSIIEKHIKDNLPIPDNHIVILNAWADNIKSGTIKRIKETSLYDSFSQEILQNILGYKTISQNSSNYTLSQNQAIGSGSVEYALGKFGVGNPAFIIAPLELKNAKIDLDAIMPGRNKTPVQQAWEYAMDAKGAKWVLVSNYIEVRLYAVGYGRKEYETFQIAKLIDPQEYAKFKLLLSASQLLEDRTFLLLKESDQKGKEITDSLYHDYKKLRIQLIETLSKDNSNVSALDIINYTQTILDRILFVAFAEDKTLLPENTLKNVYESRNLYNPQPIWENFKGLFNSIDKGSPPPLNIPGYNGGLFHQNVALDSLKLSDELCNGFKKIGEYDFNSEVSVNILGHIFEQSISDLEELKANAIDGIRPFDKKTSKRKRDGVFYTPPYITNYIVEQAVGGWLNDRKKEIGFDKLPPITEEEFTISRKDVKFKTEQEKTATRSINAKIHKHLKAWETYKEVLYNIKVLDPACGSGAFLNEVFDYLYNEGQMVNLELTRFGENQAKLFRWDKHIISKNIYGVDINRESVEITKLSLWLKTANRNEKLTYLDDNIKCGNSLVDDEVIAGELAFKWDKEFPHIMNSGGFDVIVGNPPYVVLSSFKNNEFNYLQERYKTSFGRLNTFAIFIEKIMELLNYKTSYSSIIIPDSLCLIDYYSKLREHLLNKANINEIIDLGDGVFEEATVPAIIFSISLPKNKKNIIKIGNKNSIEFNNNKTFIDQNSYYITPKNSFNLHVDNIFLKMQKLLSSKKFDRLENVIDIKIGICTGGNEKHLAFNPIYENSKKVLQGKDISKYYLSWNGMYVNYSRKELLRARDESIFLRTPKLLMRQTSDSLIVALDDNQFYAIDSLFTLHTKNNDIDIKVFLCLLNSKLLNRQYQILNYEAGRVFAQVKIDYVNELPIPILNKSQQLPFIQKSEILLQNTKELHELSGKFLALTRSEFSIEKFSNKLESWYTLAFPEFIKELAKKKITLTLKQKAEWMEYFEKQKAIIVALQNTIDYTDNEINRMVYDLYGLNSEDIAIVEARNGS